MSRIAFFARPHLRVPVTRTFNDLVIDNPNLVGWWKADETSGSAMYDSSGNGYDATYTGTQTLGNAPLRAGSTGCLYMGSKALAASRSPLTGINLDATSGALFTMALVMKRTGTGTNLSKAFGYGPSNISQENGPCIGYNAPGLTTDHLYGCIDSGGTRFQASTASSGSTVFAALVKTSSTTWELYENGSLVGSLTHAYNAPIITNLEFFGATNFGSSEGIIGYASDFMLFDTNLSAAQLLAIAQAGGLA